MQAFRRREIASTVQGSLGRIGDARVMGAELFPVLAKIQAVHSDRMTCDIIYEQQSTARNVPVLTKCGLIAGEVYGESELPAVDDTVIVMFIFGQQEHPIIVGTYFPYLNPDYQSDQTPVNSASKAFTDKILEADIPKTYRKVFKSGTTIEVDEDGTITIETPDGTYFQLDEAGTFHIEDSNGNIITSSGSTITINGNLEVDQ